VKAARVRAKVRLDLRRVIEVLEKIRDRNAIEMLGLQVLKPESESLFSPQSAATDLARIICA
jgi:hypothetical protein